MFGSQEAVNIVLLPETFRFVGSVVRATDRHLIIGCDKEDAAFCNVGKRVVVSQALDGYCLQIETHILQTHSAGFAISNLPPKKMDRRTSPRVDCQIAASYLQTNARHQGSKVVQGSKQNSLLQDISIGGARLAVPELMVAGTELTLDFELIPGEGFTACCNVIRCSGLPAPVRHEGRFLTMQAMVKFVAISRADQLKLVKFMHQNAGSHHSDNHMEAA